jgi:hypothetical protein
MRDLVRRLADERARHPEEFLYKHGKASLRYFEPDELDYWLQPNRPTEVKNRIVREHKLSRSQIDGLIDHGDVDVLAGGLMSERAKERNPLDRSQAREIFHKLMSGTLKVAGDDDPQVAARVVGAKLIETYADVLDPKDLVTFAHDKQQDFEGRLGAIRHSNFPHEELKALAKDPEAAEDSYRGNSIQDHAKRLVGRHDPDAVHSIKTAVRLGLGKLRRVRDLILSTGQKQLKPKELPAGNWAMARAPNGNIDADLIQQHIDKQQPLHFNVGHSTYGEDYRSQLKDSEGDQYSTCTDCDGDGNVVNEGDCGACDATGRPPDEECERCQGKAELPCPSCDGGNNEPEEKDEDGNCATCKGKEVTGEECDYCEGAGRAPPMCPRCSGTGYHNGRRCMRCDGEGKQKCGACEGTGTSSESERCDTCDGNGQIENDEYRDEDALWADALSGQQHNLDKSKVFQLNITTDHVNQMKQAGVWPTFQRMLEASRYSSHPVTDHTVGWIRWTGDPEQGIFVDEVQSDFGQSFVKQARAQAEAAGHDPDEVARQAEQKYPDAHYKQISQILFGGKHPNEIISEGFMQHLRDQGHHDAEVHWHTVDSKAPISLGRKKDTPPGHFHVSYRDVPKDKLAMEPATYGQIPTQDNPQLEGQPTWRGKVRKYEENQYASTGDNLVKSDPFEDYLWKNST